MLVVTASEPAFFSRASCEARPRTAAGVLRINDPPGRPSVRGVHRLRGTGLRGRPLRLRWRRAGRALHRSTRGSRARPPRRHPRVRARRRRRGARADRSRSRSTWTASGRACSVPICSGSTSRARFQGQHAVQGADQRVFVQGPDPRRDAAHRVGADAAGRPLQLRDHADDHAPPGARVRAVTNSEMAWVAATSFLSALAMREITAAYRGFQRSWRTWQEERATRKCSASWPSSCASRRPARLPRRSPRTNSPRTNSPRTRSSGEPPAFAGFSHGRATAGKLVPAHLQASLRRALFHGRACAPRARARPRRAYGAVSMRASPRVASFTAERNLSSASRGTREPIGRLCLVVLADDLRRVGG